jgi:hypothetical protein
MAGLDQPLNGFVSQKSDFRSGMRALRRNELKASTWLRKLANTLRRSLVDQGRGNAPAPRSKRGEVIVCAVDSVIGSQAAAIMYADFRNEVLENKH